MARIVVDVDDELVQRYQDSDTDAIVLTLCRGDSLNGYGWHTSAKMEYLQEKDLHEGPRRPYRHVWQIAYKSFKPFAAIDVSDGDTVIDLTGADQCDEEFLTCGSCKHFIDDMCSAGKRPEVDNLTNAMYCLGYRRASE